MTKRWFTAFWESLENTFFWILLQFPKIWRLQSSGLTARLSKDIRACFCLGLWTSWGWGWGLLLGLMLVWLIGLLDLFQLSREFWEQEILKVSVCLKACLPFPISSTVASLVWVLSFLWERMPRPAFWLHPHIELPTGRSGPHSRISIRDQVFFSADDYRSSTYGLETMDQWSAIHRVHIRWTLWLLTFEFSHFCVTDMDLKPIYLSRSGIKYSLCQGCRYRLLRMDHWFLRAAPHVFVLDDKIMKLRNYCLGWR